MKVKKTLLNKSIKDMEQIQKEISDFNTEVYVKQHKELEDLKVLLNSKKEELERVKVEGIKDAVQFLNLRYEIEKLEKEIPDVEDKVKISSDLCTEFNRGKMNNYFDTYLDNVVEGDLTTEFKENMLMIQKEMFKKFKDIEELNDLMDQLGKEYKCVVNMVDHPKSGYRNFDPYQFKFKVHQRFNVKNIIKYYTGVTNEKFDFEM